jgi:beta propeller repeat protein
MFFTPVFIVTSLAIFMCFASNTTLAEGDITLNAPNGGEVIPSGTSFTIQWVATLEMVRFKLKYSMNNGKTWTRKNKTKCLVKVIGYNASGKKVGADKSDAPFTIEVVKLTSPNGGETLTPDDMPTITWTTHETKRPVVQVKLLYTKNGGKKWEHIDALAENTGSYDWTVPDVLKTKGRCRVKVVLKDAKANSVGSDMSDRDFTIEPTPPGKVAVVGDDWGVELAYFLTGKGLTVDNFALDPDSKHPRISGDYVAWTDNRNGNSDIYAYRISTGTEFQITTDPSSQSRPRIDGDYIVWQDYRNGNDDIYGYRISTGTEFAVTTDPDGQYDHQIDGDYVVWADTRNGNYDIYAYRISTGTEFQVTTDPYDQSMPQIDGDYIVWQDNRNGNWDIYAYRISTGTEFQVTSDPNRQLYPQIAGDYIVWYDDRNGASNIDLYAYRISTGTEFAVTTALGNQSSPQIDGDYIVWRDDRNGNVDLYAYRISTGMEFAVTTDPNTQDNARIDGDYIVWWDYRNGNGDIYAYRISTEAEFSVTTDPSHQNHPDIDGDYIVWRDDRNGYGDIFLSSTDLSVTEQNICVGKLTLSSDNISNYRVIVFGDNLDESPALALFDAADAAGVNMLGIGTYENGDPLGVILSDDGRFGLDYAFDSGSSPMEVIVTAEGAGHPIFNGLDTSSTIHLEDSGADGMDEQVYYTDPMDPSSPADWTVLAVLGPAMSYSGDPAIVEFSTPNGTKVILDGSANTYDGYDYWTQERWDLLSNEVMYLME